MAAKIADELKAESAGRNISLAVVLIGDNPDSIKYVNAKQKRAAEIGIRCDIVKLPADSPESDVMDLIYRLNEDAAVNGMMVQLPMPKHIDQTRVTHAINPAKDVDGLNPASGFMPATVRGIEKILEHYRIELDGKVAVVVGRSEIVGKPAAKMLMNHNATVTVCHSHTRDLAMFTRMADILIAASGVPGLIKPDHIKDGVVIIDAGTTGDVDKSCYEKAAAYTPVPGGVGPMTIISLIENTVRASS